jgi:hypothetical protein
MAAPLAISAGSNIVFRVETMEERTQSIPTRDDESVCGAVVDIMAIDVRENLTGFGDELAGRSDIGRCST